MEDELEWNFVWNVLPPPILEIFDSHLNFAQKYLSPEYTKMKMNVKLNEVRAMSDILYIASIILRDNLSPELLNIFISNHKKYFPENLELMHFSNQSWGVGWWSFSSQNFNPEFYDFEKSGHNKYVRNIK